MRVQKTQLDEIPALITLIKTLLKPQLISPVPVFLVGVVGFFERRSRPSRLALFPTRLGGKAREEGHTVMPTNKSHYPPQAIFSDPPRPLGEPTPWVEPRRETFPPRAEEKRGLSQDNRDLPLLRGVHRILWRGFHRRLSHPSGIFFRHKRRRATRFEQRLENFAILWMERKVGQKRKREREMLGRHFRRSLCRNEWNVRLLADDEIERKKWLTSSASADEPQVVKLGDLILH